MGCNFTADAVEASDVPRGERRDRAFVTPMEFKLAMSDADLRKAALAGASASRIASR